MHNLGLKFGRMDKGRLHQNRQEKYLEYLIEIVLLALLFTI
jgi:hypothetical protein